MQVFDLSEMTLNKISTTTKILIRLREENLIETISEVPMTTGGLELN